MPLDLGFDVPKPRLGRLPLPDSDLELVRALELFGVMNDALEINKLETQYGIAMPQEEFDACCREEQEPDGRPYPWQVEFHNAGKDNNERGLISGNQTGKTVTCGWEVAIHATGRYPKWWQGRRFTNPVKICVGSETNETLRDPQQLAMFGPFKPETKEPSGKGTIPLDTILNITYRQCGIVGVYDEVQIQHSSGGVSIIKSKTYEQGWTKWQGTQFDLYWLDEEPDDEKIYSEVLRGCLKRQGGVILSRTPLFGMTWVIQHFMDGGPKIHYQNVTWEQAPHLDRESREQLLKSIPIHERECRNKGTPMLGEGAIYPIGDEDIICEPMAIPKYFKHIAGIDFGVDHPTAVCWIAYDADCDTIYVYDVYRKRTVGGTTIANHSNAINQRGNWIPVAWPHDGLQKDKSGSGENLKDLYKKCNVKMLHISARINDDKGGGQSREAIIADCYERMTTGRLKVFSNLSMWFEEKRMYHRKDNKIVDSKEDILSAMHYAVMMLRYAKGHYQQVVQTQAESSNPLAEFSYAQI